MLLFPENKRKQITLWNQSQNISCYHYNLYYQKDWLQRIGFCSIEAANNSDLI
jgi:hypothetical protein